MLAATTLLRLLTRLGGHLIGLARFVALLRWIVRLICLCHKVMLLMSAGAFIVRVQRVLTEYRSGVVLVGLPTESKGKMALRGWIWSQCRKQKTYVGVGAT